VIKLGRVLFIVEKNRGRRRNRRWEDDGRSPGHKLNIVDRFTDGSMSLVIMSVKMACYHTFWLFFFTVILLIYIKKIIMLVVTDEYIGK
jgi:hypothetical protein